MGEAVTLEAMLIAAEYHAHMLMRELNRLQTRVQPYGQRVNEMLAQLRPIDHDLSMWRLMESADEESEARGDVDRR